MKRRLLVKFETSQIMRDNGVYTAKALISCVAEESELTTHLRKLGITHLETLSEDDYFLKPGPHFVSV